MPGMKITLSAAMRARDVSRPSPEVMAEAEAADRATAGPQQGAAKPKAAEGAAVSNAPAKRRGPRPRGGRLVPPAGPEPSHSTSPVAEPVQATAEPAPATAEPAQAKAEPAQEAGVPDDGRRAGPRRTRRRRSRTRRGK